MIRSLFISLSFFSLFAITSFADNQYDQPTLSISETASIEVMPDYIVFVIEVSNVKPTKTKAKQFVDQVTGKVLGALKKFEISADHIEASQINIQPKYKWKKNERTYEGEQVNRTVKVKLYAKDKYTDLVAAISKLEITRYYQQGFGYDNLDKHKNRALLKAIKKVRRKADLIAEAFKTSIDKVYTITENAPNILQPLRLMSMDKNNNDENTSAPLEIKPQEISASISAIFTLKS